MRKTAVQRVLEPSKMKQLPITSDKLLYVSSCNQGLRWFNRVFPDGLLTIKRDIVRFVSELSKVRYSFAMHGRGDYIRAGLERAQATIDASYFLVDSVYEEEGGVYYFLEDLEDGIQNGEVPTEKDIANAVWKEIKLYGERND